MFMPRFWEIDFLRGLAIVGMVVFHAAFDLDFLGARAFDVNSGAWWLLARVVAAAFVFIAGVCMAVSFQLTSSERVWRKFLGRGAFLFALGLAITAVTFLLLPGRAVWFGVLHFLGVASVLAVPFLKHGRALLAGAIISVAAGFLFEKLVVATPFLAWLGLRGASFASLDYFPLFPWFGVLLAGALVGKVLYANGARQFRLPEVGAGNPIWVMALLGRHSLIIYFLHQPILVALILLASRAA